MSAPSIILIGASGYLGKPVTQEILAHRSRFDRIAILTQESKKAKFAGHEANGFELVIGAIDSPESFQGFDIVICTLGNHAMKYQPAIIDAAITAGVTEFYPSEFGSDIGQGDYLTHRYWRDKRITRQHLYKVAKENVGFNYTFIITGGFIEFALHPLFGMDIDKHTFTFYGPPEKQEALTAVRDVAKYLVESIFLPKSPSQERIFRIPGGNYSWAEVVATVERVQGVTYTCTYHSRQDAIDGQKAYAEKGDVNGELAFSVKSVLGDPNAVSVPKPWDNDKFSFKPATLEDTVKEFFQVLEQGEDRLARDFPMPSQS
ncbi:hypothetical protein DE146DRAFT_759474 [Phaeosphaeria sp. MPI-PUGE-AT-0046c]|nr:hypothetical protein DE146DRAFT_759474 [Phaeosphaeria sp. MPI-PUGE-AT-0046c]